MLRPGRTISARSRRDPAPLEVLYRIRPSMQESFDLTTIIFIALAVFVAWRLRSVLGQKTGEERPPFDPFNRRDPAGQPAPSTDKAPGNVVRLPGADRPGDAALRGDRWAGVAEPGSPVARGFDAIAAIEPFDAAEFVEGAKAAYEMIVSAFAAGDRDTLKGLLSKDVYEGFDTAIREREAAGQKVETTFVAIDEAKVVAVDVRAKTANVTLRFASQMISATRDKAGDVIEGSADAVVDVIDTWTFSRTLGSRDPNWLLVATESGD